MSNRPVRVARMIQRDVAALLSTDFSQDLPFMVTVTNVRMTRDLSIAYVYVTIMGSSDAEKQAAFRHLTDMTPKVRAALASTVRHQLRKVPDLKFFLDNTLEESKKLDDLFAKIRAERAERNPVADSDAEA
ncbi:MAG: 30S ribosome-binding factor RbfA [Bacteroidota bacterium]